MAKDDVAVLDFGSSKLTLLVGHHSVNNNFSITAYSDIDYSGFMDGEFIVEDEIYEKISQAIDEVSSVLKQPLSKLYVGVPSEFLRVQNITLSKNFGKQVRITKKIIDQLFVNADNNIVSSTHSVINISPLKYILDDNNDTFSPIDCYCRKIDVDTCFVEADNRFIALINRVLNGLKIFNIEYVSSILAEGQYLLSEDIRSCGALLVDVGYLTTSVAYFQGEGIVELNHFSMGGAQITAELCEKMQLPFSIAEQVKQKLLITIKATGIDVYEVYKGNRTEKVPTLKANELALNVIDEIINEIANVIDGFERVPQDVPVIYLTGGGLSYLKGIEYYMSRLLGIKVQVLKPQPLKFKKPDLSSVIGLLDVSLKMD